MDHGAVFFEQVHFLNVIKQLHSNPSKNHSLSLTQDRAYLLKSLRSPLLLVFRSSLSQICFSLTVRRMKWLLELVLKSFE